jgi:hypothetical protein
MLLSTDRINNFGQIVGFNLHDSVLTGLFYEDARSLVLTVRCLDGALVRIILGGVGPLGILGLRNGAIVGDVYAWAPARVPASSIGLFDGAWNVLFANDIPLADLPSASKRIADSNKFAFIVLIQCSYGGALAALCQTVELESGGAGAA